VATVESNGVDKSRRYVEVGVGRYTQTHLDGGVAKNSRHTLGT
jgi:hypothetical protein